MVLCGTDIGPRVAGCSEAGGMGLGWRIQFGKRNREMGRWQDRHIQRVGIWGHQEKNDG